MSAISNFLASTTFGRRGAIVLSAALWLGFAGCVSPPIGAAPAPAPAPMVTPANPRPPSAVGLQQQRPFVLKSAATRPLTPALLRRAGPRFQAMEQRGLVIDVRVDEPIDPRPRDSAPVIVLNGSVLVDTYARVEAPDQLLAFLPDRRLLRANNEVSVHWAGNARRSRSQPRPLSVSE